VTQRALVDRVREALAADEALGSWIGVALDHHRKAGSQR
jgi:hypothetical protein